MTGAHAVALMGALVAAAQSSPSYTLERLAGGLPALRARFSPAQLALLEKLNRRDVAHLARLDTVVVPDRWDLDELAYSPLPSHWPAAASHAKVLVVHQPMQALGAYEVGRLVRWGPVSTGRKSKPTPAGLFHLNWRSPGRHSTVDPDWFMRWYFNFDNKRGLSLHEFELPGYPDSHACVRMLARDARWLFDWGEEWTLTQDRHSVQRHGTPLVIIGEYAFGATPPWRTPESWGKQIELGNGEW
jgi:hypothetical protein